MVFISFPREGSILSVCGVGRSFSLCTMYSDSICRAGYQRLANAYVSLAVICRDLIYRQSLKSTTYHVIINIYTRSIHVIVSGIITARVCLGLGPGACSVPQHSCHCLEVHVVSWTGRYAGNSKTHSRINASCFLMDANWVTESSSSNSSTSSPGTSPMMIK